MEEDALRQQLGIVDQSLGFLLILIASVLLSFYTVVIQRRGLCLTILGDTEAAAGLPDVYPIKRRASAMVVGSLGFFLCLALNAWQQAEQGDDCVARRSATVNLWASLFVLLAGILRLMDLDFVACCSGGSAAAEKEAEPPEDSTLPA